VEFNMRVGLVAVLLILTSWFFAQDSSAFALSQRAADLVEQRPIRTVLIVGNSRTFFNDMPAMLRHLANSPESPVELEVETSTAPGATFESHSRKSRTTSLLGDGWDEIILQGESASQSDPQQGESFYTYGQKLAEVAKVHEGRPTLLVNWPYDPELFKGYAYDRSEHLDYLRSVNSRLATAANLDRLNLAGLWESVRLANPSLKLTSDGNHPTSAGSYLYALAVYKYATGASVEQLSYLPKGMDPETAQMLRETVDSYANL
jgi:hypothetical protein